MMTLKFMFGFHLEIIEENQIASHTILKIKTIGNHKTQNQLLLIQKKCKHSIQIRKLPWLILVGTLAGSLWQQPLKDSMQLHSNLFLKISMLSLTVLKLIPDFQIQQCLTNVLQVIHLRFAHYSLRRQICLMEIFAVGLISLDLVERELTFKLKLLILSLTLSQRTKRLVFSKQILRALSITFLKEANNSLKDIKYHIC